MTAISESDAMALQVTDVTKHYMIPASRWTT